MKALLYLLQTAAAERLGWTLLHFVWQGLAVGMAFSILRLLLRRLSANGQYLLALIGLGICSALPVLTYYYLSEVTQSSVAPPTPASRLLAQSSAIPPPQVATASANAHSSPTSDAVLKTETNKHGPAATSIFNASLQRHVTAWLEPQVQIFLPWVVAFWATATLTSDGSQSWHGSTNQQRRSGTWTGTAETVAADEQGSFRLIYQPAGRKAVISVASPHAEHFEPKIVDIPEGGLELPEWAPLPGARNLKVRIVDELGAARPNLRVQVFQHFKGATLDQSSYLTDGQGEFTMSKGEPGSTWDFQVAEIWQRNVVLPVEVDSPGTSPFEVCLGRRLAFRILGKDGQPLSIARISGFLASTSGYRWSNGPLRIVERAADDILWVDRSSFVLAHPGDLELDCVLEDGSSIKAKGSFPGNTRDVVEMRAIVSELAASLKPLQDISLAKNELGGRIVDLHGQPLSGVTIANEWEFDFKTGRPAATHTDASGVFRMKTIHGSGDQLLRIENAAEGVHWLSNARTGTPFEYTLHATARLKGVLQSNPGSPLADAAIHVSRADTVHMPDGRNLHNLKLTARSDSAGHYDIGLDSGTYDLKVVAADGSYSLQPGLILTPGSESSIPLNIHPPMTLELQLVDLETSQPIPNQSVAIAEATGPGSIGTRPGSVRRSDAGGKMTWSGLTAEPTDFDLPIGPAVSVSDGIAYRRFWCADATSLEHPTKPRSGEMRLANGLGSLRLDLEKVSHSVVYLEKGVKISGHVRDSQGQSIPAIVNLFWGQQETLTGDFRYAMRVDVKTGTFTGWIPAGNGILYHLAAGRSDPATFVKDWPAKTPDFSSHPGEELSFDLVLPSKPAE